MSIPVTCPHCQATVKAPDATAGKTVRCPACRGRVPVPDDEAVEENEEQIDEDDEDERPAKRKRATKKRRTVPPLLLVGVGTVLVTVVVVGALALAGVFSGRKPAPVAQATPDQPAPTPSPVPKAPSVAPKPAPVAVEEDPFHPTDRLAAVAVTALDKLADRLPPIPQDANRARTIRAARLAASHETMDLAFDRCGRTDAPWAAKARNALALRALELATPSGFSVPGAAGNASDAALVAAVADGCDDPLVAYYHIKVLARANTLTADQFQAESRRITQLLWDSRYPDSRKLYAVYNLLVNFRIHPVPAAEVATWETRFRELLGRVCKDENAAVQEHVIDLAQLREQHSVLSGKTREQGYEEFAAVLAKSGAPEHTRLVVKGAFLIRHAWDARGTGTSGTVTPDGFRLLGERLTEAETALTAAYELAPDNPYAPTKMLMVCMGRGHPRAEMEKWFERAMKAEPDNVTACGAKVEYLHPKWYGTQDDHVGFAWQCVRTRNTTGMLPYAAVDNLTGNAEIPEPISSATLGKVAPYYSHPQVWQVLDAALSIIRRDHPDLIWIRGQHGRLACVAGRYDTATRELAAIGNDHQRGGFKSAADLAFYKNWAKLGHLPDGR